MSDDDLRAIAEALLQRAKKGDVVAAREILDRLMGRSSQPIEMGVDADVEATDADRIHDAIRFGIVDRLPARLQELPDSGS